MAERSRATSADTRSMVDWPDRVESRGTTGPDSGRLACSANATVRIALKESTTPALAGKELTSAEGAEAGRVGAAGCAR